jgi:Na+/H+-dicarboxylate symporter
MRTVVTWMIVGSFFGSVIATLVAPSVLQTLLASTGAKDAMCQCAELVGNTAGLLIRTQMWGGAIGAAVFPIVAWLLRRRFGTKALPAAAAPAETR